MRLSPESSAELVSKLQRRFERNAKRHEGLDWASIEAKLSGNHGKLWSLSEMERTFGEPDVIGLDSRTGEYIFCDCSSESPKGRRSLCYDREARESRKKNSPESSAVEMATALGVEILTEAEYRHLQTLEEFDTRTSSWIRTPGRIRDLGGALFCDRRFDTVFVYHNGAESYYAGRAFRGRLMV
jgi:hypothetical protein